MTVVIYTSDGETYYISPVQSAADNEMKKILGENTDRWYFDLQGLLGRDVDKYDADAFLAGFVAAMEVRDAKDQQDRWDE